MMNDTFCTYTGDRDEVLVAYLYDDIDAGRARRVRAHLAGCVRVPRGARRAVATSATAAGALGRRRKSRRRCRRPDTAAGPAPVDSAPHAGLAHSRRGARVAAGRGRHAGRRRVAGIANIDVPLRRRRALVRTGWCAAAARRGRAARRPRQRRGRCRSAVARRSRGARAAAADELNGARRASRTSTRRRATTMTALLKRVRAR